MAAKVVCPASMPTNAKATNGTSGYNRPLGARGSVNSVRRSRSERATMNDLRNTRIPNSPTFTNTKP